MKKIKLMKVGELRELLVERGLASNGLKKIMVARLIDWINAN